MLPYAQLRIDSTLHWADASWDSGKSAFSPSSPLEPPTPQALMCSADNNAVVVRSVRSVVLIAIMCLLSAVGLGAEAYCEEALVFVRIFGSWLTKRVVKRVPGTFLGSANQAQDAINRYFNRYR